MTNENLIQRAAINKVAPQHGRDWRILPVTLLPGNYVKGQVIAPATPQGTPVNEVQSLVATGANGGTFALIFKGQSTPQLAYNSTAAQIQAALLALSTIGAGNVTCTGGALPGTPVVITFGGALAGLPQSLITANNALLTGGTAVITRTTLGSFTPLTADQSERQSLIATGATAGTFMLAFNGDYTSALPFNAPNAAIQAALESIPTIGAGNVAVTGGPLPGTAVIIDFQKQLAGFPQQLIIPISSLTGGTAVVTRTRMGYPVSGYWGPYINGDATLGKARAILEWDSKAYPDGTVNVGITDVGKPRDYTAPAFIEGLFKGSDLVGLDGDAVDMMGALLSGSKAALNASNALILIGTK